MKYVFPTVFSLFEEEKTQKNLAIKKTKVS